MKDTQKKKQKPLRERRPSLFQSVSPERTSAKRARIARQARDNFGHLPEAHPTKKLTLGRLWAAGRTPAARRMPQAQKHYAALLAILFANAASEGDGIWQRYMQKYRDFKLQRALALKPKGRSFLKRKFGIT